jgi:hypothetical protein
MDKPEHETSRNPDVDDWFQSYDNPQRELVASVREFIFLDKRDPRSRVVADAQTPGYQLISLPG